MVLWISPFKLFRDSVLAGIVFLLAFLTFSLDVAIIGLRSYRFFLISSWQNDNSGLEGLSFASLVSIVWYSTMIFLLCDLMSTLLIASRDLQEGAVIAFGIVSVVQVPLVALYLKYELSPINRRSLLDACIESQHAPDSSSWLNPFEHASVVPATVSCVAHVVLVGFAAWYIRHRAPTTAALLPDHELVHLQKRNKSGRRSRHGKKGTDENETASKSVAAADGGAEGWRDSKAPSVHTDSDSGNDGVALLSDLERGPPSRADRSSEKELGRKKRRSSRYE